MRKHSQHPEVNSYLASKAKDFEVQEKKVRKAFNEKPKTMRMVSVETGIDRANICWLVGRWKKSKVIKVVRFGECPNTKRKGVQFLTTNPKFWDESCTTR